MSRSGIDIADGTKVSLISDAMTGTLELLFDCKQVKPASVSTLMPFGFPFFVDKQYVPQWHGRLKWPQVLTISR